MCRCFLYNIFYMHKQISIIPLSKGFMFKLFNTNGDSLFKSDTFETEETCFAAAEEKLAELGGGVVAAREVSEEEAVDEEVSELPETVLPTTEEATEATETEEVAAEVETTDEEVKEDADEETTSTEEVTADEADVTTE